LRRAQPAASPPSDRAKTTGKAPRAVCLKTAGGPETAFRKAAKAA
jgi:hypothetical protein